MSRVVLSSCIRRRAWHTGLAVVVGTKRTRMLGAKVRVCHKGSRRVCAHRMSRGFRPATAVMSTVSPTPCAHCIPLSSAPPSTLHLYAARLDILTHHNPPEHSQNGDQPRGRARGADAALPPPDEPAAGAGAVEGADPDGAQEPAHGPVAGPAAPLAEGAVVPELLARVPHLPARARHGCDVRQHHGLR